MKKAKAIGRLFLVITLALAVFGPVGAASSRDPWCPNDEEETCEDVDEGCQAQDPHYHCRWRPAIEHCNCTLEPAFY
jgi:hypothetical protein